MSSTTICLFDNGAAYDANDGGNAMSDRGLARRGPRRPHARVPSRQQERKHRRGSLHTGVLNAALGYFLRRLQVWVCQDFIRTRAPIHIGPAQYSVLVVIAANPGLSQSDLADRLGIERARLVRLLDRLERRGLTQRLPSRTDRRSHALRLTREGQRILKLAQMLAGPPERPPGQPPRGERGRTP